MKKRIAVTLFSLMLAPAYANPELPELDKFIDEMVHEHDFDRSELERLFAQVEVKDSILAAISRPAEKVNRGTNTGRFFWIRPALMPALPIGKNMKKFWQGQKKN